MKIRGVKLQFVPRNPSVFGSQDTWSPVKNFGIDSMARNTSEMQVRAGRDSAEETYRIWYSGVKLHEGDRVKVKAKDWLVVFVYSDSLQIVPNYADIKAVGNG
jgi:hypothetical protein